MDAWGVIAAILTPLLGIVAGLMGKRYRGALKVGKALGGLSVAFGLGLINSSNALDDARLTNEERSRVAADVKEVGRKGSALAKTATELWQGGR